MWFWSLGLLQLSLVSFIQDEQQKSTHSSFIMTLFIVSRQTIGQGLGWNILKALSFFAAVPSLSNQVLKTHTSMAWRRPWQLTPVLLPRESHGQRSQSGYSLWARKVSDMTAPLSLSVSVQFSHSVVSDSLWSHGLQHARPPCSSPTPRAYPNLCPLSQWCHPTVSSCHPLLLPPSI